jgi:hypothetical protein
MLCSENEDDDDYYEEEEYWRVEKIIKKTFSVVLMMTEEYSEPRVWLSRDVQERVHSYHWKLSAFHQRLLYHSSPELCHTNQTWLWDNNKLLYV